MAWTKFEVWERGGPDGDDKFEIGTAYGRVFFDSQSRPGYSTLIVERLIVNGALQYTHNEIPKQMPIFPIAGEYDRARNQLDSQKTQFQSHQAADILDPTTELESYLCWLADTIGVLVTPGFHHNAIRLWLPNLGEAVAVHGTHNAYAYIQHMPVTVDTAAFLQRSDDTSKMIHAQTMKEQEAPVARLNNHSNTLAELVAIRK